MQVYFSHTWCWKMSSVFFRNILSGLITRDINLLDHCIKAGESSEAICVCFCLDECLKVKKFQAFKSLFVFAVF